MLLEDKTVNNMEGRDEVRATSLLADVSIGSVLNIRTAVRVRCVGRCRRNTGSRRPGDCYNLNKEVDSTKERPPETYLGRRLRVFVLEPGHSPPRTSQSLSRGRCSPPCVRASVAPPAVAVRAYLCFWRSGAHAYPFEYIHGSGMYSVGAGVLVVVDGELTENGLVGR